jgi:streptomycin 6-kinase
MAPVIPEKLQWWRETPTGAAWLDRLPRLIEECAEQWSLELEPPFERGNVSYCAPAGDAVLKINFPEWETDREADALAHWDGHGAARLLARDDERGALLMERLRPGGSLWEVGDRDADPVAAEVLARLWTRPAPADHPFTTLAEAVERWVDLDDETRGMLRELAATQGEPVVLHQDFQGSNVLRSHRGWLAIDPKPLVGEREFDLASFVRDRRFAWEPHRARERLDYLCTRLDLDRERARRWAIGHALAWRCGSLVVPALRAA